MFPRRFHPTTLTAAIAPLLFNAPSSFDPDLFMQTTVSTPMSTKVVGPTPGEHKAMIEEVRPPRVNANGSVVMDVIWLIDNEELRAKMGRKPTVRQALWLDFDAGGQLDKGEGKNVSLGRVREALGQNDGRDWSPMMLKGGVAKIKVASDINKETGDDYGKVVAVAKL